MIYCQLVGHKNVQVGSRSETVDNWPSESTSAIQDNGSRDPDSEPKEVISDPEPVFWIQMFLGLPDPDTLLRGTDPGGAPDPINIKQKIMKDKKVIR
jgi:hypothetical protein